MALQFRETFICFTSFRNASQSSLRFVYAQKNKKKSHKRRDFTFVVIIFS